VQTQLSPSMSTKILASSAAAFYTTTFEFGWRRLIFAQKAPLTHAFPFDKTPLRSQQNFACFSGIRGLETFRAFAAVRQGAPNSWDRRLSMRQRPMRMPHFTSPSSLIVKSRDWQSS